MIAWNITFKMVLCMIAFFAAVAVVLYFKWAYGYWRRLGVPYLKPSAPFGTLPNLFRLKYSFGEQAAQQYVLAKRMGYKHVGLYGFTRPEYMPIDLEVIRHMLVKDFNFFYDRGFLVAENVDPLSANLFWASGTKWKGLRAKMTSAFTSGKIRAMFNIVLDSGHQLRQSLEREGELGPVDIKEFLENFTTDVIGSSAFGLECNSFINPDSDFRKNSNKFFNQTFRDAFVTMSAFYFPGVVKFLKLKLVPREVSDFFLGIVGQVLEYRRSSKVVRNDFLQILIELMENEPDFTVESVTAQAFAIFLAAYETSSTTLLYCMFELALNPDMQDKLREEVFRYHGEELTYDSLSDMTYMGQVLDEALRKYPPIPIINRKCTEDYKLPNSNVVLKKGTPVIISALGIHRDPDYYPEPDKFDPSRFSPENRDKLRKFAYIPFGEGPRICLGIRFAVLQIKIALALLLREFKFSVNERTRLPLEMNVNTFVLCPKEPIWLDVEKL